MSNLKATAIGTKAGLGRLHEFEQYVEICFACFVNQKDARLPPATMEQRTREACLRALTSSDAALERRIAAGHQARRADWEAHLELASR